MIQTSPPDTNRIADLDRLRGYAIAAVLAMHTDFVGQLSGYLLAFCGYQPWASSAWLGVQLFFVISGFVVLRSFYATDCRRPRFYVRRVFRLWPVLIAYLGLVAAANALCSTYSWSLLVGQWPSILFGYYNTTVGHSPVLQWHGVAWSLSVEEQFYLVIPTVVLVLDRMFPGRSGPQAAIFAALYLAIAGVFRPMLASAPRMGAYLSNWSFDFIVLGVLLFYVGRCGTSFGGLPHRILRAIAYFGVLAPFVFGPAIALQQSGHTPRDASYAPWMALCGLCFFATTAAASLNRDLLRGGRMYDRVLLYLGSRSYVIYLLHFPIVTFADALVPAPEQFGAWFVEFRILHKAARLAAALVIGPPLIEAVYRFVEQPGIRLGRRLVRRMPTPAPMTSPSAERLPQRRAA